MFIPVPDKVLDEIIDFLERNGLNPIYVVTLLTLVIVYFSCFKDLKKWHDLPSRTKRMDVAMLAGAGSLILFSIVEFIASILK